MKLKMTSGPQEEALVGHPQVDHKKGSGSTKLSNFGFELEPQQPTKNRAKLN